LTERGYLDIFVAEHSVNRPKVAPVLVDDSRSEPPQKSRRLLGESIGAKIEVLDHRMIVVVMRMRVQHCIANTTADQKQLETGLCERSKHWRKKLKLVVVWHHILYLVSIHL
jgi:hypothetical protein